MTSTSAAIDGEASPPELPVRLLPQDLQRQPEDGIGLCLSGGGYRAMLFHVGALWRLFETGILFQLSRISSVSGGSITAGALGLHWAKLQPANVESFVTWLVAPIRGLADRTIDRQAILGGALLPGTIADKVAHAYERHLFGEATLQTLPDTPRFVINATNVKSGALWRFSKPFMGDYRVGLVRNPTTRLALAVAASSAFPPVLSPVTLELDPRQLESTAGADLADQAYRSEAILSDGGVYDNLGLETVFKNFTTVLVSDAGQKMSPEAEPKHDWARHSMRVFDLVDNQVRSLRKRQLIDAFKKTGDVIGGARRGAYWGIRSHFADFHIDDPLGCLARDPTPLADLKTRLRQVDPSRQQQLINWGYAICDAALRKHFAADLQQKFGVPSFPSPQFPYPETAY